MVTKPENTAADIEAQLAAIRAEIAGLATLLAAFSQSNAQQTASATFADLNAKAQAGLGDASAEVAQALATLADHARKNPLQSLGIAAGLGMLLGLLFGRR